MERIYLDYNATTPLHGEVLEAMAACLGGPPGNPSSRHGYGRQARTLREEARERVAAAAGCRPVEVLFTSGGTEADNLALRGITARGTILAPATEHEAILQTLEAVQGAGRGILPVNGDGRPDEAALRAGLAEGVALVSVMAANNETGVLADLEALGGACREAGVLFHTDAVQSFGKVSFRFGDLPLDLASISSHKIGGPKGVGALIVREGLELPPMQTGGSQERGVRPGTENLPGIVGFGKAAETAAERLASEGQRLAALRDRLERELKAAFPEVVVNGAGAPRLPNTSNVSFPGRDGESLLIALDLEGIAVSTGAACHAGASDPSHVLLAMGRTREEAGSSLRFSLGSRSQESDIVGVVESLRRICSRLAGSA
ncbi:cysteine desulfurase [bacterium]|nr:cysteine desulfurase [bacterium]